MVFLCIVLFGERIETPVVHTLDVLFKVTITSCQDDSVIEIVHRELGDATVQSYSVTTVQCVGNFLKTEYDVFHVGKLLALSMLVGRSVNAGFLVAIEIGFGTGADYTVCP